MNKSKEQKRLARIIAFQGLFQMNSNPRLTVDEAIEYSLMYTAEMDDDMEIVDTLPNTDDQEENLKSYLPYLHEIISGVKKEQQFLDEKIDESLENWTIKRIEITNLLILRMATYELYYHTDTSPNIVINEALEITKKFNNAEASKFVNGVLQGVLDNKEA